MPPLRLSHFVSFIPPSPLPSPLNRPSLSLTPHHFSLPLCPTPPHIPPFLALFLLPPLSCVSLHRSRPNYPSLPSPLPHLPPVPAVPPTRQVRKEGDSGRRLSRGREIHCHTFLAPSWPLRRRRKRGEEAVEDEDEGEEECEDEEPIKKHKERSAKLHLISVA